MRRAKEAGFGRRERLCVRGVRSCLVGRGDVPHQGRPREFDDVKGIEDAGGVLELAKRWGFCILGRGPASRFAPPHGSLLRALLASSHARCQTFLGPGLTSGPWDDPPLEWSTMPVSSRGPRRRRSWWCHTCSSTPSTRTPAKRAGSSDATCRHGLIWDHTVFHVVRHIQRRLNHRNLARTPAQGASITSTTTRPWPCAITTQPGQPDRKSVV